LRDIALAIACANAQLRPRVGKFAFDTHLPRTRAQQVEPIDLLNVDPENNDIGYIFEKMRQDPATRTLVKEQLEAWDVMAGRSVLP
jgi:hypothetical protein